MSAKLPIKSVVILLALATLACNFSAKSGPSATPSPTQTSLPTLPPTDVATATPAPSNTPTATLAPTHTPPAPTPTVLPIVQLGEVVFKDSFDDNSHNWYEFSDSSVSAQVSDGALTIQVTDPNTSYFMYSNAAGHFDDVDLTVETTLVDGVGESSTFGLQCRASESGTFYALEVTGNGRYTLVKSVNDNWIQLVDWTSSPAIKTGPVMNSLRLVCVGQELQVWINGVNLATVTDKEYSTGLVGLMVGTYDSANSNTKVSFDNFSIRLPQSSTLATGGKPGAGNPAPTKVAPTKVRAATRIPPTPAPVDTQAPAPTQVPAPTQAPAATQPPPASTFGHLAVVMCQGLEATVTIFHDGQIIQQYSLHNAGTNIYDLPPGHYDVQFSAQGYNNINLAYDIGPGQTITQYIGDNAC